METRSTRRSGRFAALKNETRVEVRWELVADLGRIRRRTQRGQESYYLDFRPYGRVYSNRGVPITDQRTAERVLRQIQARVAEGRDMLSVLADYMSGDAAPNLVSTWLPRWIEHMELLVEDGARSPTYLAAIRSYTRDEERAPFGWWRGRTVHEIKKPTLATWRDWLRRDLKLSPKSVANVLGVFRSFTRWLADEERAVLARMPAFPAVHQGDEHAPTIITLETQDAILQAIPTAQRGAFLALCLGLRPGEVRALNVADYSADGWLTVAKAVKGDAAKAPIRGTKTRRARRVPVTPELREWLTERLAGEDDLSVPLFPNPVARNAAGRWTANQLRKVWHRACGDVNVEVGLYEGTKHSSATHLLQQGVGMETIGALLGHRDRRSTERYAQLGDAALVDALARRRARLPSH